MDSSNDMAYYEDLYRQAGAKHLDRQSSTASTASAFRAEQLTTPALPHRPGVSPLDRPGLPSRPVIVPDSQCSEEFDSPQIDPNDFYSPFWACDKKLNPRTSFTKDGDGIYPLDDQNYRKFECSLSPDHEKACPAPEPPGGMKPLDPTDDITARVITARSLFVGIILSIVSAAIAQLFQFKPVRVQISLLTLQILSFLLGTLLSKILPTRYTWLNPGPYSIKEDVFATLMAAASAYAAFGTEIFAPQILFFHMSPGFLLSTTAQFAEQLLAICFAWLFRSFLVYPAACLYPAVIPPVILFQSLHGGDSLAQRRINLFKKVAPLIGVWEIFPQFLAPAFSAINVFCMALPAAPAITDLFGGSSPNTGFGLFSMSLDWTNISAGVNGASPMYVPWVAQVNSWIALGAAILMYLSMYKLRLANSGAADGYPLLSTELLNQAGGAYNRTAVFRPDGSLDRAGLAKQGLPAFTLSFVVSQAFAALLMTSAITQAVIQNWDLIKSLFPGRGDGALAEVDPHLKEMAKYPDVPAWFLGCAAVGAVGLGFLCATLAGSQMGIGTILGSVSLAAIIIGSIGFLNATAGFNPVVAPACQMIGSVFGGSVIRSMWFSLFSATCATISLLLIKDIKLMIYTKVPPHKGFLAQIIGTLIGVIVNQFVMVTIVGGNAKALVEPTASGQFSGIASQALFNEVSTWSLLAGDLYGPGKRYFFIPASLLLGIVLPIPFLCIAKWWPKSVIGKFNVPLVAGTIQVAINGTTAGRVTAIVVGFVSQFYLRVYRPQWYSDYNHVLSAALDGGTQITVLLLSFAVGGGAGFSVAMPHYLLNPAPPFLRDYCTRF